MKPKAANKKFPSKIVWKLSNLLFFPKKIWEMQLLIIIIIILQGVFNTFVVKYFFRMSIFSRILSTVIKQTS